MSFYEDIAEYYDLIFPVGQSQLAFIGDAAGQPPKRLLDVACGSGGYSVELAKRGYTLTAVDLDEKMITEACAKADRNGVHIDILQCDMLKLAENISGAFDCVFCIGNSIVHLGGLPEIAAGLKSMGEMLVPGGRLLLQIINYDRILKYGINELPPLKDEKAGIEFIRRYEYDRQGNRILFNTVLMADKGGKQERFENSIPLFPLLADNMRGVLAEAGFTDISYYGSFDGKAYNDDSYLLVAKAIKD